MSRKFISKLFLFSVIGIVFIFSAFGIYFASNFHKSIFRLSLNQVVSSLDSVVSGCTKISDCKLLPGDILIRRYITSKTQLFDQFLDPYFTHSAFYLGDDKIVEAVGTEKNHQDEIQIFSLSTSDWDNNDIESFVVIRPKNISDKLDVIKRNLKDIAEDTDYRFGLPKYGHKRASCADLILQQLLNENVITVSNMPKIITPDYLFWLATNNPDYFEIAGYGLSK